MPGRRKTGMGNRPKGDEADDAAANRAARLPGVIPRFQRCDNPLGSAMEAPRHRGAPKPAHANDSGAHVASIFSRIFFLPKIQSDMRLRVWIFGQTLYGRKCIILKSF